MGSIVDAGGREDQGEFAGFITFAPLSVENRWADARGSSGRPSGRSAAAVFPPRGWFHTGDPRKIVGLVRSATMSGCHGRDAPAETQPPAIAKARGSRHPARAAGDERLSAPHRRGPAVRVEPGSKPPSGPSGGARTELARVGAARCGPALPRASVAGPVHVA